MNCNQCLNKCKGDYHCQTQCYIGNACTGKNRAPATHFKPYDYSDTQGCVTNYTLNYGINSGRAGDLCVKNLPNPTFAARYNPNDPWTAPSTPRQANNGGIKADQRVCLETCLPQTEGDYWGSMQCFMGCSNTYPDPGTVTSVYGPEMLPKDYMYWQYPTGNQWPYRPVYSDKLPTIHLN